MAYLDDIRAALLARCPDLLQQWFGGHGRMHRNEFCIGDLAGNPGDSLKINIHTGRWSDFATGDKGGDLIGLYAKLKQMAYKKKDAAPGQPYAIDECAKLMGIAKPVMPKGDWSVVFPVPESAYSCDAEGNPALPDIPATAHHSRSWPYFNTEGQLLTFRVRFDKAEGGKEIRPLSYCRERNTGECRWMSRDLPDPLPLYGLMELAMMPDKVLICEGEKATDAARLLLPDWCVITWPGGSKRVKNCEWGPVRLLPAAAAIYLWPDRDIPGEQAMSDVRDCLQRPVDIVRTDPTWPEGWDIADLKEKGWGKAEIEGWIASNSLALEIKPPTVRPEVNVTGKGFRAQADAIYGAIRDSKFLLFEREPGLALVLNGGASSSLRILDPKSFKDWAHYHLAPFSWSSNRVEGNPAAICDDLAGTTVHNAKGNIPTLKRFAETPIFTATGRLIEKSGYDEESQTYVTVPKDYDPHMGPGRAREIVDDLLCDFTFETESDRAAAVSYPLTAIMRNMISGPTPLYRFEGPIQGVGKTKLCWALSHVIVQNVGCNGLSERDEEVEKTLLGLLKLSPGVIWFDNLKRIEGPAIERALTGMSFQSRLLGTNENPTYEIWNVWAATLNNPIINRDIFDRSVRVRLNPKVENPRDRDATKFKHYPLEGYVLKNRGQIMSAFVALAKAGYRYDGCKAPAMGSYEAWSRVISPILYVAGYKDFLKNREEDRDASADPRNEGLHEFVEKWRELYGKKYVSTKDLSDLASSVGSVDVRRSKDGSISRVSMGWFLKTIRGRVIGNAQINGPKHTESGNAYYLTGKFEDRSNLSDSAEALGNGNPEGSEGF